jgi:hypothetical protein
VKTFFGASVAALTPNGRDERADVASASQHSLDVGSVAAVEAGKEVTVSGESGSVTRSAKRSRGRADDPENAPVRKPKSLTTSSFICLRKEM